MVRGLGVAQGRVCWVSEWGNPPETDLRFCSLLTLMVPCGQGFPEAGGGGHGLRAGTSTFTSCFHPRAAPGLLWHLPEEQLEASPQG